VWSVEFKRSSVWDPQKSGFLFWPLGLRIVFTVGCATFQKRVAVGAQRGGLQVFTRLINGQTRTVRVYQRFGLDGGRGRFPGCLSLGGRGAITGVGVSHSRRNSNSFEQSGMSVRTIGSKKMVRGTRRRSYETLIELGCGYRLRACRERKWDQRGLWTSRAHPPGSKFA